MAINIVDWNNEISCAQTNEKVGIRIATLLESEGRGTDLHRSIRKELYNDIIKKILDKFLNKNNE